MPYNTVTKKQCDRDQCNRDYTNGHKYFIFPPLGISKMLTIFKAQRFLLLIAFWLGQNYKKENRKRALSTFVEFKDFHNLSHGKIITCIIIVCVTCLYRMTKTLVCVCCFIKGKCANVNFLLIERTPSDSFILTGRTFWDKQTKQTYMSSLSQVNLKSKELINNEVMEFQMSCRADMDFVMLISSCITGNICHLPYSVW